MTKGGILMKCLILACAVALAATGCNRYGPPGDVPASLERHVESYVQCRGYVYRQTKWQSFTSNSSQHDVCVAYLWAGE